MYYASLLYLVHSRVDEMLHLQHEKMQVLPFLRFSLLVVLYSVPNHGFFHHANSDVICAISVLYGP
jgi:hypothetical protein